MSTIKDSHLHQQLNQLGLEERQVNLYTTLLEKGIQTPLQLARATKINRTSVYRHLDKLKDLGLVQEIIDDNTTRIEASPPETLQIIIEEKESQVANLKKTLPSVITQLNDITQKIPVPTKVKFYKGIEGMKQFLWNMTKCTNKLNVGYGYLDWNEKVGKKFAEKVRQEFVLKQIHTNEILNKCEPGETWSDNPTWYQKYHHHREISPKIIEIKSDLYLYDDVVAFRQVHKDEIFGVEIHNKEIAKTQKQIFDVLWNMAKEVNF